ncbi:MAG: mechanosensitive ion channel family protein [Turicibacter sp.]|nr:mechanosensitive ion channel family protein [Turicibacter sp.]
MYSYFLTSNDSGNRLDLFNAFNYLNMEFVGDRFLNFLIDYAGRLLNAIIVIVILSVVRKLGIKLIQRIFAIKIENLHTKTDNTIRRKKTLKALSLNIWRYAINVVIIIAVIGSFFDLSTLLASAGFLTVIITFASQSVLADIVKGFFIVFEDIFSVGDMINIAGTQGTVLEIGIRSTKLKTITGEIVTIPNGDIRQVTNFSVSNSMAVLDVLISSQANLELAIQTLELVAASAQEKYPQIVARPTVLGVQSMDANETIIRMIAEVQPLQKFNMERELRKVIKLTFDEAGIEMPLSTAVLLRGGTNTQSS